MPWQKSAAAVVMGRHPMPLNHSIFLRKTLATEKRTDGAEVIWEGEEGNNLRKRQEGIGLRLSNLKP